MNNRPPVGIPTFNKLVGLYYYCLHYHSGQNSWQYRYLPKSAHLPGRTTDVLSMEEETQVMYKHYIKVFEN